MGPFKRLTAQLGKTHRRRLPNDDPPKNADALIKLSGSKNGTAAPLNEGLQIQEGGWSRWFFKRYRDGKTKDVGQSGNPWWYLEILIGGGSVFVGSCMIHFWKRLP